MSNQSNPITYPTPTPHSAHIHTTPSSPGPSNPSTGRRNRNLDNSDSDSDEVPSKEPRLVRVVENEATILALEVQKAEIERVRREYDDFREQVSAQLNAPGYDALRLENERLKTANTHLAGETASNQAAFEEMRAKAAIAEGDLGILVNGLEGDERRNVLQSILEKAREADNARKVISDLNARIQLQDHRIQLLNDVSNAERGSGSASAGQGQGQTGGHDDMETDDPPITPPQQGNPWPEIPLAIRPVRKLPQVPKMTPATVRLQGHQITVIPPPEAAQVISKDEQCAIPDSIRQLLSDPNVEEKTKEGLRLGSTLFGAYFTHALGGIFRSNLDGTPVYKRVRESSAVKARYRALIRRDSSAIRNDICSRIRDMFYHFLKINQEAEVRHIPPVSQDTIAEWEDAEIGGPGPTLDDLQFDWQSGRKSGWNAQAVELLTVAVKNEAESRWKHLPIYDHFYWEESVWQKFRNLATKWKSGQSKVIGPSLTDLETREAVTKRLEAKRVVVRKKARQATRRHTKFLIRKRICTAMIELKEGEGDPDDDLKLWKWALEVLCRLKADGMSSDESGGENLGFDRVYRVKIMVWRRRMDDLLQFIDRGRRDRGIFSLRGSTGETRLRSQHDVTDWPNSSRDPIPYLPYVFYEEEWFNKVDSERRQATLHVSREEFQWFRVYARN